MELIKLVENHIIGMNDSILKRTGEDKTYLFFEDTDGVKYRLSKKKRILYVKHGNDPIDGWKRYAKVAD